MLEPPKPKSPHVVRVRIDAVAVARAGGIADEVVARDQLALQVGMREQNTGIDDGDDHLIGTLRHIPRERQVDVRIVPLVRIERIVGNAACATDVVRFGITTSARRLMRAMAANVSYFRPRRAEKRAPARTASTRYDRRSLNRRRIDPVQRSCTAARDALNRAVARSTPCTINSPGTNSSDVRAGRVLPLCGHVLADVEYVCRRSVENVEFDE